MDSIRAAARLAASPRVWAVVGTVSGWAFAATVYVAGSARQSDVEALRAETKAAAAATAAAETHATEAGQRALQTQETTALALRALVGLLAYERARGASKDTRAREQAAAELRYDRALGDGQTSAAAVRSALP